MKPHGLRTFMPVAAFTLCLLASVRGLPGATFRADDRPVIEAGEVIEDDLYVFGDEVTIDGEVQGDVIAFGRLVRVNGSIEGDLIAAGQAIVISGEVGDDVRVAGQVLKIGKGANVIDDMIAGAFSLEIADASSVGGDVVYGGYQALLAGDISGNILGGMSNCEVGGSIGGDVRLNVDGDQTGAQAYTAGSPPPISLPNVPPGLTIRDAVIIEGGLNYTSRDEADIAAGAQITGGVQHERPVVQARRPPTRAEKALSVLGEYAALFVVGLCVLLVAPKWTRRLSDNIKTQPLASLGLGVAAIIGFVVLLLVIVTATIVLSVVAVAVKLTSLVPVFVVLGLSGGVVLAVGFWFFTSHLAAIILSYFAGSSLLGSARPTLGENRFLSLLVGLALLALVSSLPYLASIVGWLVVLYGLGALVGWMFWRKPTEPTLVEKPQPLDG